MARRRYGEVTSGSGKSHQGRRISMAQPVSSILRDIVKSSRSIAHSDDFEGHKLIQTNSRQGSSRQAAGKQRASSRQAAGKQQPAFAPLKEWSNIFLKINAKKCTFSRRTAPKRRNRSITKSCGDAKIELFPGARPPDTTFTSWYDLTLALVMLNHGEWWRLVDRCVATTWMCTRDRIRGL